MAMQTAEFDFDLPPGLIAAHPARPRESARLLVVGAERSDRLVSDLPELLRAGDLLVFNDTKVIPAQLSARRGGVGVEITLHRRLEPSLPEKVLQSELSSPDLIRRSMECAGLNPGHDTEVKSGLVRDRWAAFAKPAKKLKAGEVLHLADDFTAEVTEKLAEGEVVLRFDRGGAELMAALGRHGAMPLPPYIRKLRPIEASDEEDYQTIHAKYPGAVAAPTAGLHFTDGLMRRLEAKGIAWVKVTLHVGAGTFLPVKSENVAEHKMHAEYGEITAETATAINRACANNRRLVTIGTTSLRLLESAADAQGIIHPFAGETDIFITPGYKFRTAQLLMTNFHLPRTTLFMLVAAFAGLPRMREAYAHAIAARYRFFSYGDATLLERAHCKPSRKRDT